MTDSRIDGFSVMLNCLLIAMAALFVFEIEPFGKVEAGTLSATTELSREKTSLSCDAAAPLPSSITDYVTFADTCLFRSDSGFTTLDGDVLMMFQRLNDLRTEQGLSKLKWHAGAAEAARLHAVDMLNRKYFAHKSPEGLGHADRMRRIDRDGVFGASGENLAYYGAGWPDDYSSLRLQTQLEDSPPHYRVMLTPDYTHVGAAVVKKDNVYMAVQVFISTYGDLSHDWPERVSPNDEFLLPENIGGHTIGGWRLMTPDNKEIARADNRKVTIPSTEADQIELVVLAAESNAYFIRMNAPVSDLDTSEPN